MPNNNLNFLRNINGQGRNVASYGGDLFNVSKSEAEEIKLLAEEALFGIRASERAMGFQREDLEKILNNLDPDKRDKLIEQLTNNEGATSTDLEAHPELPYIGGKADKIVLPHNKDVARRREKNRKELANRLTQKYRARSAPPVFKTQPKPEYKPENRPNYRPEKPRPTGMGR